MSPTKRKKNDKVTMINFGVLFCTVFSLIYVVGLLLVAGFARGGQAGLASLQGSLQNCNNSEFTTGDDAIVTPTMVAPDNANNIGSGTIISIDDGGFGVKQVDLALSGPMILVVKNQGVNPHSFVIDELQINSGEIAPGQAKSIVLKDLPMEPRTYDFYSNIGKDNGSQFGGTITVIK